MSSPSASCRTSRRSKQGVQAPARRNPRCAAKPSEVGRLEVRREADREDINRKEDHLGCMGSVKCRDNTRNGTFVGISKNAMLNAPNHVNAVHKASEYPRCTCPSVVVRDCFLCRQQWLGTALLREEVYTRTDNAYLSLRRCTPPN